MGDIEMMCNILLLQSRKTGGLGYLKALYEIQNLFLKNELTNEWLSERISAIEKEIKKINEEIGE